MKLSQECVLSLTSVWHMQKKVKTSEMHTERNVDDVTSVWSPATNQATSMPPMPVSLSSDTIRSPTPNLHTHTHTSQLQVIRPAAAMRSAASRPTCAQSLQVGQLEAMRGRGTADKSGGGGGGEVVRNAGTAPAETGGGGALHRTAEGSQDVDC